MNIRIELLELATEGDSSGGSADNAESVSNDAGEGSNLDVKAQEGVELGPPSDGLSLGDATPQADPQPDSAEPGLSDEQSAVGQGASLDAAGIDQGQPAEAPSAGLELGDEQNAVGDGPQDSEQPDSTVRADSDTASEPSPLDSEPADKPAPKEQPPIKPAEKPPEPKGPADSDWRTPERPKPKDEEFEWRDGMP